MVGVCFERAASEPSFEAKWESGETVMGWFRRIELPMTVGHRVNAGSLEL